MIKEKKKWPGIWIDITLPPLKNKPTKNKPDKSDKKEESKETLKNK